MAIVSVAPQRSKGIDNSRRETVIDIACKTQLQHPNFEFWHMEKSLVYDYCIEYNVGRNLEGVVLGELKQIVPLR